MCEAIDSCITQLKAQGPSRTCNESKEEEEVDAAAGRAHRDHQGQERFRVLKVGIRVWGLLLLLYSCCRS